MVIDQERAGKQTRFAEDLEAVADTEHEPALIGELDDLLHDRRETGDRAGTQVVTVGETAGHDDRVNALEITVFVPQSSSASPTR